MKVERKEQEKILNTVRSFVPWNTLEFAMVDALGEVPGGELYKEFEQWMYGQTHCEFGVYIWDLETFLRNGCKDAHVYD